MYRDVDEDNDDEYNAISVTHLPLTSCAAKTAQEAIALKQLQAEKEFGAINWDIDKEKSSVIDGIPSHEVRVQLREGDRSRD